MGQSTSSIEDLRKQGPVNPETVVFPPGASDYNPDEHFRRIYAVVMKLDELDHGSLRAKAEVERAYHERTGKYRYPDYWGLSFAPNLPWHNTGVASIDYKRYANQPWQQDYRVPDGNRLDTPFLD